MLTVKSYAYALKLCEGMELQNLLAALWVIVQASCLETHERARLEACQGWGPWC